MKTAPVIVPAGEVVRKFAHYSDVALARPVVVTRNGRPRTILISWEEYDRLKKRDQIAHMAADTPDYFIADLEKISRGGA